MNLKYGQGIKMATTCRELRFYSTSEAIEYVGWLLAACADININKGIRLLNDRT